MARKSTWSALVRDFRNGTFALHRIKAHTREDAWQICENLNDFTADSQCWLMDGYETSKLRKLLNMGR